MIGVEPVRVAVRNLQKRWTGGPRGLAVACYHLVDAGVSSPTDLDAHEFEDQIAEIAQQGWRCTYSEAVAVLGGGAPEQPRLLVTFDDAYANFAERAWPVLQRWGVPAVLYVPVDFVDGRAAAPMTGCDLLPLSWSALADLVREGLTVGSHTLSHPDLRRLGKPDLERELRDSRRRLEDRLATPVDSFCYPRGLWNRRVEQEVRRTYRSAVVGGGRRMSAGWPPSRMMRTSVRRGFGSLRPLLASPVYVEEWLSDVARRWR